MKVLMIAPKVDAEDEVLGFTHAWITALAGKLDSLEVLTLERGEGLLPANVRVHALGKKSGTSPLALIPPFYATLFRILSKEKPDLIFCHMYPEFTLLAAPLAITFNKPIVSWYTHKNVDWKLSLLDFCAAKVVTASDESYRLPSAKKIVLGHGIDMQRFASAPGFLLDPHKLVSIGRISPVKDLETAISALGLLAKQSPSVFTLDIIGAPLMATADTAYLESLHTLVRESGLERSVRFLGGVPFVRVPAALRQYGVFVHASKTGSLDKAPLEAMASGLLVLSSNPALRQCLRDLDRTLGFPEGNASVLAEKINALAALTPSKRQQLSRDLRAIALQHSLDGFIERLLGVFRSCLRP